MTKLRTIAAVALAAGTFGGAIGALATAAVQSQAAADSAAAAQSVSDRRAENFLLTISDELAPNQIGKFANRVTAELVAICENTKPQGSYAACRQP
jgi:hypothetical protein